MYQIVPTMMMLLCMYVPIVSLIFSECRRLLDHLDHLSLVSLESGMFQVQVEAKLARLEEELAEAVGKKMALAKQADDCEKKLDRAGKLIGGLGGERTRWIANIASIEVDLKNVIGDVTVAGGHIAYTGPFTPPYRLALNNDWVNLLVKMEVNLGSETWSRTFDCVPSRDKNILRTLELSVNSLRVTPNKELGAFQNESFLKSSLEHLIAESNFGTWVELLGCHLLGFRKGSESWDPLSL